ncbi:MAG: SLC13 family permease [Actinobacteria bacterium]|nr:SLC13 family permease [Actinomycetota bacterium]
MGLDAWLTLLILAATVGMLIAERMPPAFSIAGAVLVLLLLGVIDESEALSGFSNPAPATVAALYVLAGAFEATGGMDAVADFILGRRATESGSGLGTRKEIARIAFPAAVVSALIANTPVVAMAAPRIQSWARRTGRKPSNYLMPLSFAAILGGVMTTIGTSTNLVVSGLLQEAGMPPLGIFEISGVGVPIALAGLLVLVALYPVLMAERHSAHDQFTADAREFTVEMIVDRGGALAGKSVTQAGLRNLQGVYLVEIERDDSAIAPVSPDEQLAGGDRLIFAGNVSKILDLARMRGLTPAEERHFAIDGNGSSRFFEVVVGADSALIGSTLKEVGFRSRYNAAVLALHRAGESVHQKLGEVPLRPGDVLLLLSDRGFRQRWGEGRDFLVVSIVEGTGPVRSHKSLIVQLAALGMVVAAATGMLSLLQASLVAVTALLVFGVVTPAEAHRSVDVHVILLIAASFGLGHAVTNSGLAEVGAVGLTALLERFGDVGVLAAVLLATMALTSMISNNAAAVLMFPLAIAMAAQAGLDPRPLAIAVMVGASVDFLTPVGYQTNTMVYGMGGYRFGDFARLGTPITVVAFAVALVMIPLVWPLR